MSEGEGPMWRRSKVVAGVEKDEDLERSVDMQNLSPHLSLVPENVIPSANGPCGPLLSR